MANKRHKLEEIVQKLRQVDVLVGQGMQRVDAIRKAVNAIQKCHLLRKAGMSPVALTGVQPDRA